jgi:hypothetical protein
MSSITITEGTNYSNKLVLSVFHTNDTDTPALYKIQSSGITCDGDRCYVCDDSGKMIIKLFDKMAVIDTRTRNIDIASVIYMQYVITDSSQTRFIFDGFIATMFVKNQNTLFTYVLELLKTAYTNKDVFDMEKLIECFARDKINILYADESEFVLSNKQENIVDLMTKDYLASLFESNGEYHVIASSRDIKLLYSFATKLIKDGRRDKHAKELQELVDRDIHRVLSSGAL